MMLQWFLIFFKKFVCHTYVDLFTFTAPYGSTADANVNTEGLILGWDFAAGSCEMYEFFVYFNEMHELSV
jgi:hypothetical protein